MPCAVQSSTRHCVFYAELLLFEASALFQFIVNSVFHSEQAGLEHLATIYFDILPLNNLDGCRERPKVAEIGNSG